MNTKRFKNDRRHIIKHKETQKDFKEPQKDLRKGAKMSNTKKDYKYKKSTK